MFERHLTTPKGVLDGRAKAGQANTAAGKAHARGTARQARTAARRAWASGDMSGTVLEVRAGRARSALGQ